MKQNTRFENFGNTCIGYRSIIGRNVGISPKKAISLDLYLLPLLSFHDKFFLKNFEI